MRSVYVVAVVLLAATLSAQLKTDNISEAELQAAIKDSSDCDELDQIHIDHLEFFDFSGDGVGDAVVDASTCMTGTAGPDIHSVYTRDAEGNLVEMPFQDKYADPTFGPKGSKLPVFGNPNYELRVQNGLLLAHWMDSSDRSTPLMIWYKWDGKQFVVDHMKVEGPFPTSYDCAKADKEIDRAICYSPKIAALDVELGQAYRERIKQLAPSEKDAWQQQQRDWIANRNQQCVIYKWWVDCLADLYQKRIAKLKQSSN